MLTSSRLRVLAVALLLLSTRANAQQPVVASQPTGSNLHVVVDTAPTTAVTGTFWQATQPISGTITANLGTLNGLFLDATFTGRMPAGASPANGESNTNTSLSRIGGYNFIYNGSTWDRWTGAVTQATGTNLHMVCDSGCSSSTAPADASTFTPATTPQSPAGGFFQTTATNNALTNLQMGAMQLTAQRALFTNLRNASGTEIGTSSNPVQVTLANTGSNATAVNIAPVDSGGTTVTNTTAHAIKTFPVDPATGTALTVPSSGNGTSDSGTTRVAIASNNSAVSGLGAGATGSAPPVNAVLGGGVTSGATGGLLTGATLCDSQGWLDMTTATTTEIAPLVSSRTIYVCSVVAMAGGTTTMTFKRGTGSNCGTGTTSISPGFELIAQAGFAMGNGAGVVLGPAGAGTAGGATTSGNAVCVTSSAAVNLHVLIRYAVY